MYGYEICQHVSTRSDRLIHFTEGAIYPSLHRLEKKGLLKSRKEKIDGRVRKYYSITDLGSVESGKLISSFNSLSAPSRALSPGSSRPLGNPIS